MNACMAGKPYYGWIWESISKTRTSLHRRSPVGFLSACTLENLSALMCSAISIEKHSPQLNVCANSAVLLNLLFIYFHLFKAFCLSH